MKDLKTINTHQVEQSQTHDIEEASIHDQVRLQNSALLKLSKKLFGRELPFLLSILLITFTAEANITRVIQNGGSTSKTIKELKIHALGNAGGALQDAGDQISFTINYGSSSDSTQNLPVSSNVLGRVPNSWKLTITDVGGNGGLLSMVFNIGSALNSDYSYYLLSRAGTSGDFSIIDTLNYHLSGDKVIFSVDIDHLTSTHYFTLGISAADAGYCLNFDSATPVDRVQLPITLDAKLSYFTAELWFQIDEVKNQEVLIGQANGTGKARNLLLITTTGKLRSKLGNVVTTSSDSVLAGHWHHAAISYNGTNVKLYLDGIHEATAAVTAEGADGNWYLGASGGGTLPFNGSMDEVRIWNDVRTEKEIRKYMNRSFDAGDSNVVAYYRFDQSSGGYLPDVSSNGNGGTLNNFSLSGSTSNWVKSEAPVVGKTISNHLLGPGNGLDFDGSDDYVTLPGFLDPSSSNWTFEAWLKNDQNSGFMNLLTQEGGTGSAQRYLSISDTTGFHIEFGSPSFRTATNLFDIGEWFHLALTYDNDTITLFIDGILIVEIIKPIGSSDGDIFLGSNRGTNRRVWNGAMDEIRFWSTTKTAKEIQEGMYAILEGTETGLLAYYNCDQVAGTSLKDQFGSSHGTLSNFSTPSCWVSSASREPYKTVRVGANGTGSTWKGGVSPSASTDHLVVYHDINMSSGNTYKSLQVNGEASVTLSADINVGGDVVVNGVLSGSNKIVLNGSEEQYLAGEGSLGGLEVNNSHGVALRGDLTVAGSLTLTNGHVSIGNHTLTLSGTAGNGSSSSYLKMDSTSKVKTTVGSSSVTLPIGRNPYLPVVLSDGGGAEFTVGLVENAYTDPTTQVTPFSSGVVSETWTLQASQAVNNVSVTLQWDSNLELSGFNRTACGMGYWESGASNTWQKGPNTAASGAGPYTLTHIIPNMSTDLYYLGVGTQGSALPVLLSHFTADWATPNTAVLQWQTATEENNSHFEIQRALSGVEGSGPEMNWETIGRVGGHGTTLQSHSYQFIDNDLAKATGTIYYRLKQVDYNGQFEYSAIRTLTTTSETTREFSIYPNPSSGQLIHTDAPDTYRIITTAGIVLKTSTQTTRIYVGDLAPGSYIIENSQGNTRLYLRN